MLLASILLIALSAWGQRAEARTHAGQPPAGRGAWAGIAGCYALFDRDGRSAAGRLYWAPATARLDAAGRAVRLTPAFDAGRSSGPGAYRWSLAAAESLRVVFHNGFSGTEFVLGRPARGDTLRGRARELWDSGPQETDAGPASAVRIPCPSPADAGRRAPDS